MYVSPFLEAVGSFDTIQTVPSDNEPVLVPDDEAANEDESPVLVDVKLPTLTSKVLLSPLVNRIVVPIPAADTKALGVLVADPAVAAVLAFDAYDALNAGLVDVNIEPVTYEALIDWVAYDAVPENLEDADPVQVLNDDVV
jgi:hypothetical protein